MHWIFICFSLILVSLLLQYLLFHLYLVSLSLCVLCSSYFLNSVRQKYNNNWNALVSLNETMLISIVADRFRTKRHCNLIIIIRTEQKECATNGIANSSDPLKRFVQCADARTVPFYYYYNSCCLHFSSISNVSSAFFYEQHRPESKFSYNEFRCNKTSSNEKQEDEEYIKYQVFWLLLNPFHFRFWSFKCTWKIANKISALMPTL